MKYKETYIYIAIIALLNIPLLLGSVNTSMIYSLQNLASGRLWTIATHPFIHVSLYHLMLDGAAFVILYSCLAEPGIRRRTIYVAGCGLTSLLAALVVLPTQNSLGYCGLSGIAHGLMAITCLEMVMDRKSDRTTRAAAAIAMLLLLGKCIFEAVTGSVVFSFMHAGNIGTPVAICHAGGVLGGCLLFAIFKARDAISRISYVSVI